MNELSDALRTAKITSLVSLILGSFLLGCGLENSNPENLIIGAGLFFPSIVGHALLENKKW